MLHHHQRVLAFEAQEQLCRARGFFIGHARHGLIEQQQFGVLHQQHANLQPLLLSMRQLTRHAVHAAGQMDGVQHFGQAIALFAVALKKHRVLDALVRFQGKLQVFKHRQLFKHRGFLKLAANAQLRNLRLVMAQQINGGAKEH